MTSEFKFDGKTRPLKIENLKPSVLAKVFRLDENSLVLTDEEGSCYLPDDGKFDPELNSDRIYIVDGIELSGNSTEEVQEKQLALKSLNDELMSIQGNNQQDLIMDVISNCKDLDDSANMLFNGPQAVVLVQALAILAVCAPDPKLEVKTLNKEVVARLGDPGSFRASLLHVANKMCNAFRQGDYAMKKIRASLIDLPDYFEATLEVVGQDNDEKAKKTLTKTVKLLKDASDTSKKMAKVAKDAFEDVIYDIDALSVAATSSKTQNERLNVELKKLKDEMDIRQTELKEEEHRLKEEYEEAQVRAKEALKEYRDRISESTNLGKLFLATLTDGMFDVIKAGIAFPKEMASSVAHAANSINPFSHESIKCSATMKVAVENGLIQCLDKIAFSLANPNDLDDDTIYDFIYSLKDFQKYSPATKEGAALFNEANKVKMFLERNKKNLKNFETDEQVKKELVATKSSIQNIVSTVITAHEEKKRINSASTNSLREQMIKADTERVRSSQDHLTAAEAKAEARRKELIENKKELTDILVKLKSIDTETTDLTQIITYLRSGVEYLGKVKKNWEVLSEFFNSIQIIVEENLAKNINNFIEEAKDPISRKLMLQAGLKATGYCIQVSNAADIYCAVSQRYIMPVISSVGEQIALTPEKARQKQYQIEKTLNDMDEGVTNLIKEKQDAFENKMEEKMQKYARNMVKAVKLGNNAATKSIKK